jgi:DUF2075 family protein
MSKRAYYAANLEEFLHASPNDIIGKITQNHSQNIEHLATYAWASEIDILKSVLSDFHNAHILFELQIPRMGRRADVALIIQDIIFIIEFKVGAKYYAAQDLRQAHGYALDLHNFHEGSHEKTIVPILFATEAIAQPILLTEYNEHVFSPFCADRSNLLSIINFCINRIPARPAINYQEWESAPYKPTPTIIEAAQALYADHDVTDIARNDAGAKNLHLTSQAIKDIIHAARINKRKTICFVTGVPGAGKTLVGLNIATSHANVDRDEYAVFLSGNGPLVEVLTEALARDSIQRIHDANKTAGATKIKTTKANEIRKAEAKIQNIHKFRDESLKDLRPPAERVVIFDEAQRAWDLDNTAKFMIQKRGQKSFNQSEPEFLISVMDRHIDWCVIIALIGGGQEINTGEAGLQGWVDALSSKFSDWDVHYSDKLMQIEYAGRDVCFKSILQAQPQGSLHLATSMRSFRAEKLSHMIHYLIHNQPTVARDYYQKFKHKFPIKITRDLATAKAWIKSQSRANETKGIIASSGAIRLKPESIFVKNKISAADWFLNDQDDIRSCHFLEDVATEFDIQGLELDWCLVGWDADYRYNNGRFEHWKFTGTNWKQRHIDEQQRYLENAYRVLLTRARQGMVIFVPHGDNNDPTRSPALLDETFSYLLSCGVENIINSTISTENHYAE